MATYAELKAQIHELEKQAEAARQRELAEARSKIHELMQAHGITAADLGRIKRESKPRGAVPAKYKDPVSGKTWTGRGRVPGWLEGRNKADFLID